MRSSRALEVPFRVSVGLRPVFRGRLAADIRREPGGGPRIVALFVEGDGLVLDGRSPAGLLLDWAARLRAARPSTATLELQCGTGAEIALRTRVDDGGALAVSTADGRDLDRLPIRDLITEDQERTLLAVWEARNG